MHISFSSLAILAAALGQARAFVVDIYDTVDCTGPSREVNIWDNTCGTWMGGFKSAKPKVNGGSHQFATFYHHASCSGGTKWMVGWVDGGDPSFEHGSCLSFFKKEVYGIGSWLQLTPI